MTTKQLTSLSPRAKSLVRLLVMVELSLVVHLAIIFGIQVGAVERGGLARQAIEARLMPASPLEQDGPPQQILVKAIDRPIKSHVEEYRPPAQALSSDQAKPQSEQHKPGLPEATASPTLVDVPLPHDPTYYPSREVDEPAVWAIKPNTPYPAQAAKENIKGEVLMLLLVDEFGGVQEASVVEVKPPGFGFEEAALASSGAVRFKPAMRKGRAVKSRVVYRVTFEP
ncbi:MAG: TonB family protein [Burkholderiales bacterium]|nr:TonB family protein [Burkholderiales bacterium]